MPVDIAFVILQENLCVNMLQGILFGNVYLQLELLSLIIFIATNIIRYKLLKSNP